MKLIKNYLSLHLKICLEYKSSFILTIISQTLAMFVELFTVMSLLNKFKLLEVYNTYELLLGFSILWLGFSLSEMFGRGYDNFSKIIINGNFDMLLIRPRSLFIQIFGSDICYEKIGRVIFSIGLLVYSIKKAIKNITIIKLILIFLMIIGCIVVIMSVFIIGASFCFITIQGLEVINIFTNGTRQVAQYPMGIYKKAIRLFFSSAIPIALVNYYPIRYLTDKSSNIIYILMPFLTLIVLFISVKIFKTGIKKYCSTGS